MKESNVIYERLIATAIEATVIVAESQLHGDPVPSLRSHKKRIVEERALLYANCGYSNKRLVDEVLRDLGLRALEQEFWADARRERTELRGILLGLVFYEPAHEHAHEHEHEHEQSDIFAVPDFESVQLW